MYNQSIRLQLRGNGIPMWLLAEYLGISEASITRMFRHELTADQKEKVYEAIDKILKTERS